MEENVVGSRIVVITGGFGVLGIAVAAAAVRGGYAP
jgi:hypothetical protein